MEWSTLNKKTIKYIKKYRSVFRKAIKAQNEPFLSQMKQVDNIEQLRRLANNYQPDIMPMNIAYNELYQDVAPKFALSTYSQFKKAFPETYFIAAFRRFAATKTGNRIVDVTNTTKDDIVRVTQKWTDKAATDGLSIFQITKGIQRDLGKIDIYRAERIARTEVITAANVGNITGARATGMNLNKVWLAANDNRTRDSHIRIDNQVKSLNEKFGNGLDFPGDPDADASEVINCRCTLYFEPA